MELDCPGRKTLAEADIGHTEDSNKVITAWAQMHGLIGGYDHTSFKGKLLDGGQIKLRRQKFIINYTYFRTYVLYIK